MASSQKYLLEKGENPGNRRLGKKKKEERNI
jgi:hypothetical protein